MAINSTLGSQYPKGRGENKAILETFGLWPAVIWFAIAHMVKFGGLLRPAVSVSLGVCQGDRVLSALSNLPLCHISAGDIGISQHWIAWQQPCWRSQQGYWWLLASAISTASQTKLPACSWSHLGRIPCFLWEIRVFRHTVLFLCLSLKSLHSSHWSW